MSDAEKIIDNIISSIPEYCRGDQLKTFTYIYYKVACMLEYDTHAEELIDAHLGGYYREQAAMVIEPASTIECIARGRALCSGYAEVLNNILNKVGISTKVIIAKSIHEWNQVFINGKWYNCDLTNDRDFIIEGLKCPHFLTSNSDDCNFYLRPPTSDYNECNETISEEIQEQLLDEVRNYFETLQSNQSFEEQGQIDHHSKFGFMAKIREIFVNGGIRK